MHATFLKSLQFNTSFKNNIQNKTANCEISLCIDSYSMRQLENQKRKCATTIIDPGRFMRHAVETTGHPTPAAAPSLPGEYGVIDASICKISGISGFPGSAQ